MTQLNPSTREKPGCYKSTRQRKNIETQKYQSEYNHRNKKSKKKKTLRGIEIVRLCRLRWNLPGPDNYALQYADGVQTYITESVSHICAQNGRELLEWRRAEEL